MRLIPMLSSWKTVRLALMGPPGAGKTSVGRMLADKLGVQFIDMDDDVLQPSWGTSVANELKKVGNKKFVQREGETAMNMDLPSNFVLSLSGSNPLYSPFMDKLKHASTLRIFLDMDSLDIIDRLEHMKVDRIVSHDESLTMREILSYRSSFYEKHYDMRILCGSGDTQQDVLQRLIKELGKSSQLISTRSDNPEVDTRTFKEVIGTGLANDGGLFVPTMIPRFSLSQWQRMMHLSYTERALRILEQWISHADIQRQHLRTLIENAFQETLRYQNDVCPMVSSGGNLYVQELFHGPTASFKDMALQVTARLLPQLVAKNQQVIAVATSGDTGSAVLSSFKNTSCPVVVLYPKDGVSDIQRLCMTQFHDGIQKFVCGVDSDFDFCQTAIKTIFQQYKDELYENVPVLNGMNSINWGRLLPQIVYHCSAYLDLIRQKQINIGSPIQLVIPTGNFGNALSAFYAKQMGIPISKIAIASNENDILHEFLSHGQLNVKSRKLIQTPSPAVDILRPSNLERLIYHFDSEALPVMYNNLASNRFMQIDKSSLERIKETFVSGSTTSDIYMPHIASTLKRTGYLMDPHTSVAHIVCQSLIGDGSLNIQEPVVVSSTAHPAKFANDVLHVLGESPSSKPSEAIKRLNGVLNQHEPGPHPGLNSIEDDSEGSSKTWSMSEINNLIKDMIKSA